MNNNAKYQVYNIAGGTEYSGNNLSKAIEIAENHLNEPYVYSEKGKRSVVDGQLGEWE